MIGKKGILRFFYKVTMVCYKKLHLWRIPIPGRDKVQADLNRMHPGENPQECVTDYYVTKLTLSAVILIAGIMLAITMHYSSRESHILQNQWVYRGSGEEGSREYSITGQVEDGERYSFQMEVMPRKYSQSELENLYEQFGRELPQLILEKNDSPDEIRENLDLSETYEGYPFLVNWKSNSTEAVEENGQIHPGQEDVPVLLRAEIQYGEFVRETTVKVTVVKRNETPQEREKSKLSELLQRAQEEDPESEKIQLPTEIEGRKISWEEDIPETGWKILAGALLLAAAVFFFQDKDLHDLVEKKKREERRSYPEILQKLTLYLEAGLTVRSAFCRVAEDYEKERKRGGRCREAYEEMLIATREIHMGVPEGAAYENFGKRTGVREYVRLSTFLTQNLKKGSSTLLQQLKEESVQAEELLAGEKSGEVTMLVVAESSCEEALNTLQPTCQAILNESGTLRFHQFPNINKYQEAGQVWKELLALYVETTGIRIPLLCAEYKTRFIGMYSPVHRCLQSTFALSFAQLMAEKHPTLYLNFEHYVGIIELLPERQDRDLADLLYFLAGDEGKFPLRMQTVIQRKGNLDYIPPMRNGQNLLGITWEEWRSLFQRIEELGKYEYVILDLSESIQGLLDVLQMCIKVFTLTREDKMSQCKLDQYEQLLSLCEKEEVKGKTRKLNLPYFQRLPVEMEQYTRGELADYVRKEIETLEE